MEVEYSYYWFEKNADEFEDWFDAKTFNWWCSHLLAMCCSDHFNIWWDKDKYDWTYVYALVLHCCDYKHVWCQDKRGRKYLFYELGGGHGYLPIVKVS